MPQLDAGTAERTAGWEMEDGVYEVELKAVYDADPKTHKAYEGPSGPYWNWLVIFPDDANGGRFKRREIYRIISLGASSDGMRAEAYTAFGIDPGANTDTGIGKRALAKIEMEEYGGVTRPKIRSFYPKVDWAKVTGSNKAASPKGAQNATEEKNCSSHIATPHDSTM